MNLIRKYRVCSGRLFTHIEFLLWKLEWRWKVSLLRVYLYHHLFRKFPEV